MNTNLYLGIDVSKGYADMVMLGANKTVVGKPFQLYDIDEGYKALDCYLASIVKEYKPSLICAAVESTGSFENHWLEVLYKLGSKYPLKVARLNPFGVSKYRQADMKVQVTDRSSSMAIAGYLINHSDRIVYYEPDAYAKYRSYLSHIDLLTKQKVQLSNILHQYLYSCFPEILPYCRNGFSKSMLDLLEHYPSSSALAKSRLSKHNKIAYISSNKWLALRDRCKLRADKTCDELISSVIVDTAKQIRDKITLINNMYDTLYSKLPKNQLEIMVSMPGIGKKTAVILLCIIGDINRFSSPHQIVGYFGLYPVINESGDGKKKPHLSRKGNTMLRKHLFMSALVACNHDPHLGSVYHKAVEKGLSKKAAICKVMKKMLRIIYGMLLSGKAYDASIDASYRDRYKPKPKPDVESWEGISQTLNSLIQAAPISRKNAHIRKEQTEAIARTQSSKGQSAAPSVFLPKKE